MQILRNIKKTWQGSRWSAYTVSHLSNHTIPHRLLRSGVVTVRRRCRGAECQSPSTSHSSRLDPLRLRATVRDVASPTRPKVISRFFSFRSPGFQQLALLWSRETPMRRVDGVRSGATAPHKPPSTTHDHASTVTETSTTTMTIVCYNDKEDDKRYIL